MPIPAATPKHALRRVPARRAAVASALLAALALGACGAPKFPAGNDHDGNITQRSVENPNDMATTDEMMDSTPNSKIYPPAGSSDDR